MRPTHQGGAEHSRDDLVVRRVCDVVQPVELLEDFCNLLLQEVGSETRRPPLLLRPVINPLPTNRQFMTYHRLREHADPSFVVLRLRGRLRHESPEIGKDPFDRGDGRDAGRGGGSLGGSSRALRHDEARRASEQGKITKLRVTAEEQVDLSQLRDLTFISQAQ